MKTTKFFLMAALALTFAACSNDDNDAAQPAKGEGIAITAKLAPKSDGAATRAVADNGDNKITVTWAENEHIAILYTVGSEKKAADATITAVDGDGAATISFSVADGTPDNTTCTLVYPASAAKDDNTGVKDVATLLAAQNGTLSANLDVRVGEGTIQTTTHGLTVSTQPAAQFAIFKFTTKNADGSATIDVKPLTITIGEQAYVITPSDATNTLYAALPEVSSQKVRFSATGSDSKTYAFSKNSVSFTKGKFYQSTLKMADMGNAPAGCELVDLGLSVKWANMNVGATSESDYGDFFAWGATTDNLSASKNYQWTNTPYYTGDGSTHSWSKYTGSDKTTLDPEDDAATANWGGDWRMPTNTEINELLATKSNANYTWEWTTVDGHNGYKITYTSTGANIFLPASGGRADTSPYSQGTEGYYWSSTFDGYVLNYAQYLFFDSSSANANYECRYVGFPVRPVQGAATPAVPTGALSGKFSVSATKKVNFSKGNLQYQASTSTWRFAENQYDYVGDGGTNGGNVTGSDNRNISENYTGWIDLFGWGTKTNPTSTSTENSSYSWAEWGENATLISALGSGWRTLSSTEWEYLFGTNSSNKRATTSDLHFAKATVNSVPGVILLPDDWSTSYYDLSSADSKSAAFTVNQINSSDWSSNFEAHGCVFLPAAGYRDGTSVNEVGEYGYYWSNTANGDNAYNARFGPGGDYGGVYPASFHVRNYGRSVRLVHDAN